MTVPKSRETRAVFDNFLIACFERAFTSFSLTTLNFKDQDKLYSQGRG